MLMRDIHFFSGNILLKTQMGSGKTAPIRNNQTRFLYIPPGPNSLLGPMRPHITDASKVTRYLGHVHGLLGWRASTSHMFSMLPNIHHATDKFTIPDTMVPTSCIDDQNSHIKYEHRTNHQRGRGRVNKREVPAQRTCS